MDGTDGMDKMDERDEMDEQRETPAAHERAVVFLGALEDCKIVLATLDEAGVHGAFHDAERLRPDLRNRGYYLVTVAPDDHERARAVLEARMQRDMPVQEGSGGDGTECCPACGAALPAGCAACPECGLAFE